VSRARNTSPMPPAPEGSDNLVRAKARAGARAKTLSWNKRARRSSVRNYPYAPPPWLSIHSGGGRRPFASRRSARRRHRFQDSARAPSIAFRSCILKDDDGIVVERVCGAPGTISTSRRLFRRPSPPARPRSSV
jgi:hypothetical protein